MFSSWILKGAFLPPRRVRKLGPKQGRKPEYIPARRESEGGEGGWVGGRETGGRGQGDCLPSISAPVDEIWLRNRLTVPISSWQLFLGLERNTSRRLNCSPSSDCLLPGMFFNLHPGSPVQDSELDVAGEAGQLQGKVRVIAGACSEVSVLTETEYSWEALGLGPRPGSVTSKPCHHSQDGFTMGAYRSVAVGLPTHMRPLQSLGRGL